MDEGIDPMQMCQNLVEKVSQSKQLSAVVDPEVMVLFENWLEELESEVISFVKKRGSPEPLHLAEELGLSRSGATFLITKLRRENRLQGEEE